MELLWALVLAAAALALGVFIGWLLARQRNARELAPLQQENATLQERSRQIEAQSEIRLASERQAAEEKLALLEAAELQLREAFQALASQALQANNESFLKLAESRLKETQGQASGDLEVRKKEVEGLVKPIQDTLKGLNEQVHELERKRVHAYAELTTQVTQLLGAQQRLQSETGNLVQALRAPNVRGKWGEVGLRRLVEMAGMLEHCDFDVQKTVLTEGGRQQPDMIIHLPGERTIILDSKAPLPEFLAPVDAQDEGARRRWLEQTARAVREHMAALGSKAYWTQFAASPDMVILFLPTESVFFAALEQDPDLIVHGIDNKVALLTPATLILVLRTIAFAWRQERMAQNAEEVRKLGNELYKRIGTFLEQFARVRKGLESAVRGYNEAAGSLEHRLLPQARRFPELGATSLEELPVVETIDTAPRALQATELHAAAEELPPYELPPPALPPALALRPETD